MKKIITLILVLSLLTLSLAACGSKESKSDDKGTEQKTETNNNEVSITKGPAPTLKYLYNTSEGHKAIGEYLQAAVATVGINMTLENQEWATFLNTRKDGNYSIARNGWVADYSDPICFLDMWTTESGNNDVQYGKGAHKDLAMYSLDLTPFGGQKIDNGTWSQTYDVLIGMIKKEADAEKRFQMMHMAEDLLMSTGCIVPLYFYTDLYMLDENVKGFYSNPLGYKYFMNTSYKGQDSLAVCIASEPDTIDPALNSAVDGATLLAHLFSGLAKWSQDASGKLIIVSDAAKELPEGVVNADGTVTYTYTLKDGLKWSDGKDVLASDFEYAWKRAASTTLAADYGYMFDVIKGYGEDDVDGLAPLAVTSDDAAKTITVTLNNLVAYWNELLAFPTYFPVRKDVVANEGWAAEAATYVCNGPYTIKAWEHKSLLTLEKNENYSDAASVTMKELKFFLSDDANNMLTNFKNRDWQLIDEVPTNEIAALKKDFPTEFVIAGQIGTYYVCWNINEEILPANSGLTGVDAEKARQEIRNAIGLLFDRNYIVEDIGQAGQIPAASFVAMGMKNPDGTEFYTTSGNNADFDGYYDVSKEAFESNCKAALATLEKYYTITK